VVTPEGYVFCKEAILEYFLSQKKIMKKKVAAWEAQQQEEATKARLFISLTRFASAICDSSKILREWQ
jgi:hypothetical protein